MAKTSRGVRASTTIETLLVLFPFLLGVLASIQFLLLALAQQVFSHALYRAARASSVILFEAPERYEDAPLGESEAGTPRYEAILNAAEAILSLLPSPKRPGAIAAALSSPSLIETKTTLAGARDAYIELSFHETPSSHESLLRIKEADTPYLRLSYLYRCRVPLVRTLICRAHQKTGETNASRKSEAAAQKKLNLSGSDSSGTSIAEGNYFHFQAQIPVALNSAGYLKP